jgi:hypothetical protein
MLRRMGLLVGGILAALGLVAVPVGIAHADTITPLPIKSYYQMVVDSAHGHIFISQGTSTSNGILVTNLSGQPDTTIDGQNGVMGLALSADGSTLYAALSSSHEISAISTATLKQTAVYPLPSSDTPQDVAVQSGKVWVSYTSAGMGAIGDINLAATPPAFETQAVMGGWAAAPKLAADPPGTGLLVAADPVSSPAPVASYKVSVDPATVNAKSKGLTGCTGKITDAAVAPAGKELVLACGGATSQLRYNPTTLARLGSYHSTANPDAVAIATSGTVAAGTPATTSGLFIYKQATTTAQATYDSNVLATRGLAWSADGTQLYAITTGGGYNLHVFYPPRAESLLTINAPTSSPLGKPLVITGTLTLVNGSLPTGTTVTVTRTVSGGGSKQFTAPVTDGKFSVTDTPSSLVGEYTYTATYSGSSLNAPASADCEVQVTRAATSLTVTTGVLTFTDGQTISITAHLGTTYTNRTVSIYAQTFGSKTMTLLKTGTVNSNGALSTSYPAGYSTTFIAVFTGDPHYAPVTVKHPVVVRVLVTEKLSGYYGSTTIHGITYRLYHPSNSLDAAATVAPNHKGECLNFEYQEYFRGTWYDFHNGCVALNSVSQVAVPLSLTGAATGQPYRIRGDFEHSSSDTTNINNDSSWQYFMVEK